MTKPKILFVDDEESILSAARRLFRGHNIQVLTTSSPVEALSIIDKEDPWVVISDYKMPKMNGIELLSRVRKDHPRVARMMLTGFMELPIIKEAINKAGVFRFISKPWDENELIVDINAAIHHSQLQRSHQKLIQEVSIQNQRLEIMTQNLEGDVLARTRGIEESKKLAEEKQRLVRDLTAFVKNLARAQDIEELYETLYFELRKMPYVGIPYLLLVESSKENTSQARMMWREKSNFHEKIGFEVPDSIKSMSVRTSSPDDLSWWKRAMNEDVKELVSIPIRARDTRVSNTLAILFVKHQMDRPNLDEFLARVTERLQPVSIVLDKIFLRQQLLRATQQWEATFDGFSDPIAVVDHQERVIRANKTFFKQGKTRCHEMLDDRSELCVGCPMPQAVLTATSNSGLIKTSKSRSFQVQSYPVLAGHSEQESVVRVVNHYTDVTAERDLYMKLVQSEKLAAVGLLAGNIAHELNNPLSGIRAMAQILLKGADEPDFVSDVTEVEKAAGRCQQIIKNLLTFSSPQACESDFVDINTLIESTLPLLKTALRMLSLQTHYGKNLPMAKVRASQIQQVIFNLINNACQAMGREGTLVVKTGQKDSYVYFEVADTGPGISEEIQERIFEPFFTTKSVGIGTGLGLSVSKSIVEKMGGYLTLHSMIGQGSSFTVYLPSGTMKS